MQTLYVVLSWLSPIFDAFVLVAIVIYLRDTLNWSILRGYRPTAILFAASYETEKVLMVQRKDGLGGNWIFPQVSYLNDDSNVVAKDGMEEFYRLSKSEFSLKREDDLGELKVERPNLRGVWRRGFCLFKKMRGKRYIGFCINVSHMVDLQPGVEINQTKFFTIHEAEAELNNALQGGLTADKQAVYKKGLTILAREIQKYKDRCQSKRPLSTEV